MLGLTIGQWLAVVRDLVILGILVWLLLLVYRAGENHDLQNQVQALQKQMAQNAQLEAGWAAQRQAAEEQRVADDANILAVVGKYTSPIVVYRPASGGGLPGPSPSAGGGNCPAGGDDKGTRVDIRPFISAFERKYEEELAECRAALASWPAAH